jgi:hypothetical protein
MDFAMQKCGLKNNWQSRATTTHGFLYVAKMEKFIAEFSCNTARARSSFNQQKREVPSNFKIRFFMYDLVLAFTLFGAKVDESVTRGTGPYSFCIHGELYHKIRFMCLAEGQRAQFA